ncbi:amidohydrolase family protein [Paucilactobacillus suebicus]|uniref:O-pyrocatechuate decarboxylase n=1 Tax=Paucilactobacillus suebicus DSM 5007 = KCTC 3549 TaxID=1423807 RepID=A0A0R1WCQ8_9LACO|nr:amidohydrolase family protein [Paucilactobacillus suebicus]KRM13403.1 o-pyrocatechuate decarboxylase [Paucilactobacillus suebicus DSM 5007 = KCTC 3549]
MKLITLEEHAGFDYANKAVNDFLKSTTPSDPKKLQKMAKSFSEGLTAYAPTPEQLQDLDQKRLDYMDKNGIDMQVLSYLDPNANLDMLPEATSVPLFSKVNDSIAAAVKRHPDRFAGFATLPTFNPTAAAEELHRAVTELGMKGAMILGTTDNGHFLDEERFFPIFEMAAKLDVPLYIHPSIPNETVRDQYYSGMNPIGFNAIMATPGWGWHMEAGLHINRLILSGLFDKLPNLKLISGHWGEFVPFFLERIDEATAPIPGNNLQHPFSYYYKKNIYITPSGMFTWPQMQLAMQEVSVDHIVWAQDYPFVKGDAATFLAKAPITEDEKEMISHTNTEKLLHL